VPRSMRSLAITFAYLLAVVQMVNCCSNLMISRGASNDNSTHVAYNSDGQSLYGYMVHLPAGEHNASATRAVYEFTSGIYLGEIAEAAQTFNVVGNMNEWGVTIAETTFDGLESLAEQPGAILDYYSLMWITLQRARTAREAVHTMDALVQRYGYASTGESFSIGDPKEVWIMEMIGKGKGERGAVWVARRVPDGFVCAHANQARITTFPRGSPDTMFSPDVVTFAVSKGLYPADAPEENFSFSDIFDPVTPLGARLCEARVWELFRHVTDPSFAAQHLAYARGLNLTVRMPLWVRATTPVPLNQTMWLMRSHYRGSWFDQRGDVGAGPFHSEIRMRPNSWQHGGQQYVNDRNIGYQGTFFNFVAHSRGSMPLPLRGVIWFGVDDPSHSVRTPMYATSQAAPETYAEGNGNSSTFTWSAFWVHNLVANLAYTRWDLISPEVQGRVVDREAQLFQRVDRMDRAAMGMLQTGASPGLVVAALTNFSVRTANQHVSDWMAFWQWLVVRHRDGLVVTPGGPPIHPKDKPPPANSEAVGYDTEWYSRIAEETGERYLVPSDAARDAHEVYKMERFSKR